MVLAAYLNGSGCQRRSGGCRRFDFYGGGRRSWCLDVGFRIKGLRGGFADERSSSEGSLHHGFGRRVLKVKQRVRMEKTLRW